jgi:hypothetical protein
MRLTSLSVAIVWSGGWKAFQICDWKDIGRDHSSAGDSLVEGYLRLCACAAGVRYWKTRLSPRHMA